MLTHAFRLFKFLLSRCSMATDDSQKKESSEKRNNDFCKRVISWPQLCIWSNLEWRYICKYYYCHFMYGGEKAIICKLAFHLKCFRSETACERKWYADCIWKSWHGKLFNLPKSNQARTYPKQSIQHGRKVRQHSVLYYLLLLCVIN